MIILPSILPGIGIVISEEGLRGSSLTLCRKSSHASFSSSDGISIEICNIGYRAIGGSVFDYKNKGGLICVTIERQFANATDATYWARIKLVEK